MARNLSIFLALITASLIIATGSVANARPCGRTVWDLVSCTPDPTNPANNIDYDPEKIRAEKVKQERISIEKAKAKEREEAERVSKIESDQKANRGKFDCLMKGVRDEDITLYHFPHKNHTKNYCEYRLTN